MATKTFVSCPGEELWAHKNLQGNLVEFVKGDL
jgi:hypothetical protein